MKNENYSPYGTYGLTKIDAPKSTKKNEPKSEKTTGSGDLRGGNRK